MKKGIELIAEERQRQIDVEGYSEQHDSQHNASELIYASIAYVESAKVGVNCSEMGNTDEHEIMRRKQKWEDTIHLAGRSSLQPIFVTWLRQVR